MTRQALFLFFILVLPLQLTDARERYPNNTSKCFGTGGYALAPYFPASNNKINYQLELTNSQQPRYKDTGMGKRMVRSNVNQITIVSSYPKEAYDIILQAAVSGGYEQVCYRYINIGHGLKMYDATSDEIWRGGGRPLPSQYDENRPKKCEDPRKFKPEQFSAESPSPWFKIRSYDEVTVTNPKKMFNFHPEQRDIVIRNFSSGAACVSAGFKRVVDAYGHSESGYSDDEFLDESITEEGRGETLREQIKRRFKEYREKRKAD